MVKSVIAPVDLAELAAHAATQGIAADERQAPLRNGCRGPAWAMADGERIAGLLAQLLRALAAPAKAAAAPRLALEPRADGRLRLSVTAAAAAPSALRTWLEQSEEAWVAAGAEVGIAHDAAESTCWFEFRQAPAPAGKDTATAAPSEAKFRVLYVEDDPSSRKLAATVLRRAPHIALLTAADGVHALEQARRWRPAAILADINVPGLDGYGLLRALREHPETAAIPVIAVSAEALGEDVERAIAAGFHAYVCKPFQPDELVAALRSALPAAES